VLILNDSSGDLVVPGSGSAGPLLYSVADVTLATKTMRWFLTIDCGGSGDGCKLISM
jgi:hypothetical protein